MAKQRKCTKDPILESDDENNCDDSDEWRNTATQSTSDDSMEFASKPSKSTQAKNKTKTTTSNVSAEGDNLESLGLDPTEFDPTKNLRIRTKLKRSNHPVWDLYGVLQKKDDGRDIAKAKDRIFCKKCFELKVIKR